METFDFDTAIDRLLFTFYSDTATDQLIGIGLIIGCLFVAVFLYIFSRDREIERLVHGRKEKR